MSESVSHPERTHLRSRVSGFVGDGFGDFGVWEFGVSGVGVWGLGFHVLCFKESLRDITRQWARILALNLSLNLICKHLKKIKLVSIKFTTR